jgi:hypothetical protein
MALLRQSPWLRIAVLLTLLCACCGTLRARDPGSDELKVKAAFLLNFAAFVDWPAEAFASETAPFVVGVYGADPFGPVLDEIFAGEAVRGRGFVVRRIRRGDDVRGCHILFVCDSERNNLRGTLARLRGSPTLTVANVNGFAQLGGMIEFTSDRGRVRFLINNTAARAAGLTIGSKLLRLAESTL